jgi:hypothetical protein
MATVLMLQLLPGLPKQENFCAIAALGSPYPGKCAKVSGNSLKTAMVLPATNEHSSVERVEPTAMKCDVAALDPVILRVF